MGESEEQRAAQKEEGRNASEAKRRAWRQSKGEKEGSRLPSELTVKSRGRRGGSLSEILIKLYDGRREPENLASLAAGMISRGERPESRLNQRI
jgi:hypothetical protein